MKREKPSPARHADYLVAATEEILAANALDMAAAKGKISDVMLDRLYLDAGRIERWQLES